MSSLPKSYDDCDHWSRYELLIVIYGFIRDIVSKSSIIPDEIIQSISLYHWPKLYDDFNSFLFYNAKNEQCTWKMELLKYYVMPLTELKKDYLLPFIDIDPVTKIAKYSSFNSKYCPSNINQSSCMIHQVKLDSNNSNIYHLMDSFVVNKFIEVFKNAAIRKHWKTKQDLPTNKGVYGLGFRCLGHQKQIVDKVYIKYERKLHKLWIFMGGNFDILQLNHADFAQKCLYKQLNIHLNFDPNYVINRDMFRNPKIKLLNYNKLNDTELVYWIFTLFSTWNSHRRVTLDDIATLFSKYKKPKLHKLYHHLECKHLVVLILISGIKDKLNDNHKLIKSLNEWQLKLNKNDAELKGFIKYDQDELKLQQNKDKDIDGDDLYGYEDDINNPLRGQWRSWREIEINNNNLCEYVYPYLMTDIMFSNHYSYGSNSLDFVDLESNNWEKQRKLFGRLFLKLFSKNDKINNKIRGFWCEHPTLDFYDEDNLSADKMLCCIDNEKIVAIWSYTVRLYG